MADNLSAEILASDGWTLSEEEGFHHLVGPIWQRDEDELVLGFIAEPKHRNRHGVVHGGMLATLADRTLGQTARRAEPGRTQVTIHLDLNYVDSAKIGEFVTAKASVVRQTRALAFLRGELFANDRLIAYANGIWRIRPSETR